MSINEDSLRDNGLIDCFSCEFDICYLAKHGTCSNAYACYTSTVYDIQTGEIQHKKGCLSQDMTRLVCGVKSNQSRSSSHYITQCCRGNLCNNKPFPELNFTNPKPIQPEQPKADPDDLAIYFIALFICILISIVVIAVLWLRRKHQRRMSQLVKPPILSYLDGDGCTYKDDLRVTAAGDSTLREVFEHSMTSGSGSGLPLLIQRTLSKQIHLAECIGKGRYGEVWRGIWHGENIAVKIFFSRDEASWTRETEIYSTIMLRHENILAFLGSDVTSINSCTQLWVITNYHQLGSLYDYLNITTLTPRQMISILVSITSGLLHLHTEIFGTQGKPAIAHRDIKSKNILMTSDSSCCIADFGLAVTHTQTTGQVDIAQNHRVGTKRYMAPEVLDETMKSDIFESYKLADIYSFALVLWEVGRRCELSGCFDEYNMPYQDVVPSDPSFEDMRKVVCVDQQRPGFSKRWSYEPILEALSKIILESWAQNPSARITALRIKKSLIKISLDNIDDVKVVDIKNVDI